MSISVAKSLNQTRKANKADVAAWFEVSVVAVDGWIRRGCPYVQRGQKGVPWVFDLRDVAAWRFGRQHPTSEPLEPEHMEPRERRDWYEGEAKRIAIEREKGELRTLDEFRTVLAVVFKELAQVMETMPDLLEREYAIAPALCGRIQSAMDEARNRMYAALGDLDEPI